MKRTILLSLLSLLLFSGIASAQQNNFEVYPDSLNKKRLKNLIITESVLYGASMVGLYYLWYKEYPQSKFHFVNDNNSWRSMDKMGHFFSTYNISRLGYSSFRWTGLSEKKATWYGGLVGYSYMTIEYH